ncbi:MAG: Na/Pi cotransporter family protein, partial [Schwartzia sp.]|nr:Na/Pi cotransporter family protein [Schwartzia sp. (in: firmicutes)]
EPETNAAFLDERLFETPSLVVNECNNLSVEMANMARTSVEQAIANLHGYSDETSKAIGKLEKKVDQYEDRLGSYLVRLSQSALSVSDNRKTAKILHSIGNFERISDHAINLVFAAKEISEKNVEMSEAAAQELHVLESAVSEILRLTTEAYAKTDIALAEKVEPLEQVIDLLTDRIRLRHIDRLQAGACTIERGFVFADILSNYERISDHCSNIAVAVLEADADVFDPHEYLRQIKTMDNPRFRELYTAYKEKYPLA